MSPGFSQLGKAHFAQSRAAGALKPPETLQNPRAGIILAYSNSVAGRLSDITVSANAGNIGCFLGGTLATLASGTALILFTRFGSLGDESALTTKPKKAGAA